MSFYHKAVSTAAAAILVGVSAFAFAGCTKVSDSQSAASSNNGVTTINFVLESNDKPYSYADENGDPAGFDLDVLKAIDDKLDNYTFTYQVQDYDTALVGVKQGKYDALIGAFFETPARAEEYQLSTPYNYYFMNLIVPQDSSINSLEDLNGKTIDPIVPTDGRYVALQNWLQRHPDVKIDVPTVSNQETFPDMINSVHDGTYAAVYLSKDQYDGVKDSLGYEMKVTDVVDGAGTVILYNKDNQTNLKNDIDTQINALISDGTFSDLSNKWFNQDNYQIAKKLGLLS